MSALTMQHVVVRMLFDADFAERVYRAPDKALAVEDLTDEERALLVQPDPRSYRADEHRASRALSALFEEYPVSSAVLARGTVGIKGLHRFFSSEHFHKCIQNRGLLTGSYGLFLEELCDNAHGHALLRLERVIVDVRRGKKETPPTGSPSTAARLQLAPWARVVSVDAVTLDSFASSLKLLDEHPKGRVGAILDDSLTLPAPITTSDPGDIHVLALCASGFSAPTLEVLPDALAALLYRAETLVSLEALADEAVRLGADADEASELLGGLVQDGLLIWSEKV